MYPIANPGKEISFLFRTWLFYLVTAAAWFGSIWCCNTLHAKPESTAEQIWGFYKRACYWCQTGLGAGKHTTNKVTVNRSTIQRPLKDPQKSETKHQKSPKDPASERPNVQIWVAGSKVFPLLYPMFHLYIFTWSCFGKSWSYYSLQLYLLDAEDQRTGGGWWFCSIIGWYVFVVISRYVIVTIYLLWTINIMAMFWMNWVMTLPRDRYYFQVNHSHSWLVKSTVMWDAIMTLMFGSMFLIILLVWRWSF